MKPVLMTATILLVLAGSSAAGPKMDALVATVGAHRVALTGLPTFNPQSAKAKDAGLALLDEALTLFAAGGDDNTVRAFATLGKGLALIEKAGKKEVAGDFAEAAAGAALSIWGAAISVFTPGVDAAKGTPEEQLLKKLSPALRLSGKGKYGKAVAKLAKAWRYLVVIAPNP